MILKTSVALVGDSGVGYRPTAAQEAIEHASSKLGIQVEQRWLETPELTTQAGLDALNGVGGIWIVPGSPYKCLEGVLAAIRLARERTVSLLATCAGFQHVVLEYVRNVLGFNDAVHAEYEPDSAKQAISRLSCSLVGRKQLVTFSKGSKIVSIYGRMSSEEEFYCNYGVGVDFVEALRSSNLKAVGTDQEGSIRAVELGEHPFFVGTLFIPQYSSWPDAPHPLISAFLGATLKGGASAKSATAKLEMSKTRAADGGNRTFRNDSLRNQ